MSQDINIERYKKTKYKKITNSIRNISQQSVSERYQSKELKQDSTRNSI